jgi:putative tryptophan/tyrosine transport system ATP-binding protein
MLKIENLHQTFHRGEVNEVQALRGIDLNVPEGQFVTIIGSNGAGKSTLFNTVAGVDAPTEGRILIDGNDVTRLSEHRRASLIGRVFQNPLVGTAAGMTIAQNLTLALLRGNGRGFRRGVTPARRQTFEAILEPLGLGLESRLDARVSLLSGGQRQALTLIMATMVRPKLLLLDEHTAALDPRTAGNILDLTKSIVQEQGLTTLMITHNMHQALTTGDRTLMMDEGKFVLDLTAEEQEDMTVQDLIDEFSQVRQKELAEDELLLA